MADVLKGSKEGKPTDTSNIRLYLSISQAGRVTSVFWGGHCNFHKEMHPEKKKEENLRQVTGETTRLPTRETCKWHEDCLGGGLSLKRREVACAPRQKTVTALIL